VKELCACVIDYAYFHTEEGKKDFPFDWKFLYDPGDGDNEVCLVCGHLKWVIINPVIEALFIEKYGKETQR